MLSYLGRETNSGLPKGPLGTNAPVDYVMRFETLQSDFDAVCRRIGIPAQMLPRRNKSYHRPYREYYDAELIDLVSASQSADIEHFGYRFDDR